MAAASVFLDACRRRPTAFTPVWLMRQAGAYMPEYRAMRERHGFLELCKNPQAAAEVTLQPGERLGVDAAILFADILLVLEPLGVGLEFTRGEGPHIERPVRSAADVARLEPAARRRATPAGPASPCGGGTAARLPMMKEAGGDVIGLDWRGELGSAWERLGFAVAVQGNLDPAVLPPTTAGIRRAAKAILDG